MVLGTAITDQNQLMMLLVYCTLIVLASLTGGWLPQRLRLTHTRMQIVISLVGGLMLGIGLFHMLPHAIAEMESVDHAIWWMMIGILVMFFMLRVFHFHHHGSAELPEQDEHEHTHACDNPHHHHPAHDPSELHRLDWAGVAFGLGLHTLLDGIALAASLEAESLHQTHAWALGLGTFLAIVLHKPLDAATITALMTTGGWSMKWRRAINTGFAMMCPLGAMLFVVGANQLTEMQHVVVGGALAFSAGVFLCISMGDLLPELGFHSHDRFKLSAALLGGVILAYAIGCVEPAGLHKHSDPPTHSAPHAHDESG